MLIWASWWDGLYPVPPPTRLSADPVCMICGLSPAASAPVKAIELLGASPSQGIVTTLKPTVVTAFP